MYEGYTIETSFAARSLLVNLTEIGEPEAGMCKVGV